MKRYFNKPISIVVAIVLLFSGIHAGAQDTIRQKKFFTDTALLRATLSTDLGNLVSGKIKDNKQGGTFTLTGPDSSKIVSNISLNARGHMRKETCYMPPLKVQFNSDSTSPLASLKSLKLVVPCEFAATYQQLLLKEYMVYKIYNLFTDMSFRVRLVSLNIEDSKGKKKGFDSYGFFLEDIDQLAKRFHASKIEGQKIGAEATDKVQILLVYIFEYMIGNTDWSVPAEHNIKLIQDDSNSTAPPYAIPYDFDYSGLVNAPYAIPDPLLGIERVTERMYRGFPRTMEELEPVLQQFRDKKDAVYSLINNFDLFSPTSKKDMIKFLDDFYKTINKKSDIQVELIDKARQPGAI
jgi:hypothetical protein